LLQIFSARYRELVPEKTKKGVCALILTQIILNFPQKYETFIKPKNFLLNKVFVVIGCVIPSGIQVGYGERRIFSMALVLAMRVTQRATEKTQRKPSSLCSLCLCVLKIRRPSLVGGGAHTFSI
jgi:hypothetical protein